MKKYIYITIISLALFSCGGAGGDDIGEETGGNNAPTRPNIKAPANNLLCIDNNIRFEWNRSSDQEGDAISYTIEISKDNQFNTIEYSDKVVTRLVNVTLEKGVSYYWRVKATDSQNNSSEYSTTYQFYTEGDGTSNHLPFAATLVGPSNISNVTGASVTLEWTANDVDTEDQLTYDVYFGTSSDVDTLVSENLETNSFNVSLTAGTKYYWKVDVKDNHGAKTQGQVWTFTTN
ncbi:fibronectin type III domain-containing protein [Wenyingzhuangia sp. chi5]|uniref:Fibronectin type III domain-containing protein n=1 Tax=Wenyingzhuangia gilva TaxID=3057677 RepID=A0ABT8VUF5_9FLAO|nr:fibronectin type III domain-containing protein [Wenyingzhuangia sp. chi5]MDO3695610.1 fibronectin type III domain-containing protein [Wenyingzhuangia sp. chi5]